MKVKKFLYIILSVGLIMGLLGACSKKEVASNIDSSNTSQEASKDTNDSAAYASVTIEHIKGTVTVAADVKKAVVLDYGILDIIDALGIDVEIATAVSSLPAYLSKFENASSVGSLKEPDLEAIFEFEPDVIFISGRQQDYYDQLLEIAPTIYVETNGDTYLDDVKTNIGYVAQIFSKENEAEEAINKLNSLVEEVQAITAESNEKVLILLTNDGSVSVYGSGSRFGMIHDILGAKAADENIESSTHGQSVNFEYIADKNPDIILVIDRTLVVGGTNTANAVLDNDLVNGTNAAINNRIVSLNPDIWYLSGGGITSTSQMIIDVREAYKN
jgi:iron complex transport system substrate-binding protein